MAVVLDEELVRRAIELALPSVREIVKETWGPEGVIIAVWWPVRGDNPYTYSMDEMGPEANWPERWGEDFRKIVLGKISTSRHGGGREGRDVLINHPWSLHEGDSLYFGSAAEDDGLIVAATGAYEETDETVAWIVWNIIRFLCLLKVKEYVKAGVEFL